MSVDRMRRLYDYNLWAWNRVFPSVEQLSAEEYARDRGSFWGSIHQALVHSMSAEWIWLSRIHGTSPDRMLAAQDFADFAAVQTHWMPINAEFQTYVGSLTDGDLQRTVVFSTTGSREGTMILGDLLQHVINHATEHRSQISPVLWTLGVPTPPLDYMLYCLGR
jgi:uncharacterized damage-inducible protein DinB